MIEDHDNLVSFGLKLAAGIFLTGIGLLFLVAAIRRSGEPPLLVDNRPTAPIESGGGW
jgi:hypothetical protein